MNAVSPRTARLVPKLRSRAYRHAYMSRHVREFLATQLRALRGDAPQAAFGKRIDKPQSVVSRLEDPDYGQVTLQTLLDIAEKLDLALMVRFVGYADFVRTTNDLSETALKPGPYDQVEINRLLHGHATDKPIGLKGAAGRGAKGRASAHPTPSHTRRPSASG